MMRRLRKRVLTAAMRPALALARAAYRGALRGELPEGKPDAPREHALWILTTSAQLHGLEHDGWQSLEAR